MREFYNILASNVRLIFYGGLLANTGNLAAQPWCPSIGAQWWHTYSQVGGLYGTVLTTYTNDSLISGEGWQKLRVEATYQDLSSNGPVVTESWFHLTRTTGSTVLIRHAEEVDTLYRFDALVGDRWSVPYMTPLELTYVVTAVGDTVVDGSTLGWAAVDVVTDDGFLYYLDTLLERVGFLDQFINPVSSLNLEPDIVGIRCYSDLGVNYQRRLEEPCDVGLFVPGTAADEPTLSVWQNEGADALHVRYSATRPATYHVWDVSGRSFAQGVLGVGETTLQLPALPSGVYVIRVLDSTRHITQQRWVRP